MGRLELFVKHTRGIFNHFHSSRILQVLYEYVLVPVAVNSTS
jgi:hypothetical protein